jgi:hypothetical protein
MCAPDERPDELACKIDAAEPTIGPIVATIAGTAIDPDYHIDRERQFDLARPWGLPSRGKG